MNEVIAWATSRYWPDERDGFRAAIESRAHRYDLMALEPQSAVQLIPVSKYPPLRGTRFTVGDLDYLYTTGYIAALGNSTACTCQPRSRSATILARTLRARSC
jgi:hypothetical protein